MIDGDRWCQVASTNEQIVGFVSGKYLREALAPDADTGSGPDVTFDATGFVPCAVGRGAPTSSCKMGVVRRGGGTATVTVFLPNAETRVLHFQSGDLLLVEGKESFQAERDADLLMIRIDGGAERYEVPDAVLFGG